MKTLPLFGGPRGLAVLSCALALLAAQPGQPKVQAQGSVIQLASMAGAVEAETAFVVGTKRARETVASVPAAPGRRLHILATVEILHRLLAFELRARDSHFSALVFEPVCMTPANAPVAAGYRIDDGAVAGMSVEGRFAIARLLLAPPVDLVA